MEAFKEIVLIGGIIAICLVLGVSYIKYMNKQKHKANLNRIKEREAQKANMK